MMLEPVACILLAAGASTRLGSPKQLIEVDGEPLVARAARVLLSLEIGPVGVVVGAADLRAALATLPVARIENPLWQGGLGTSIRAGIAWARSLSAPAAMVVLCDQPEIDVDHLRALAERLPSADAVATEYAGEPGVPAIFAAGLYDRLLALPDHRGAKAILSDPQLSVSRIACEAAAIDLDTPADVARWSARDRAASGKLRPGGFSS